MSISSRYLFQKYAVESRSKHWTLGYTNCECSWIRQQNQWLFAVTCHLGMTLSMKMLIWISQRYIPNAGAKFHDQWRWKQPRGLAWQLHIFETNWRHLWKPQHGLPLIRRWFPDLHRSTYRFTSAIRINGSPCCGFHRCLQFVSKICSRVSIQALNLGVHQLWVLMNPTSEPMAICCDLSLGYAAW
jgi:hypothetical protein